MAKKASKKKKAPKKKKVARSAARKAAAPKRKGQTKTVAKKTKKKKKGVVSKAKQAPRQKVAEKKEKKAKATPKANGASRKTAASARKPRGAKTVKRKPAARHPPLDLRRFRQRLRERQSELLQAYISTTDDSRSRQIDGTEDYIDYAVSSYDREFLLSLTELEQNQLALVEAALKRLDAKEFGLCTQCERPIPTKRLEVQPWARYCLRCQELADQGLAGGDDFPSDADEEDPGNQQIDADIDPEDQEAHDDNRLVEGG